jgi:copper(I)-binding protein
MPLLEDADQRATNSAVYLTLQNAGDTPDRLLGGRTPAASAVEVHQSRLVDDVMRMEKLDGLELPPGSRVELKPGGVHLMLMGLTRSLEEGGELELTLSFERSGDLILTVPVRNAGGA